MKMRSLVTACFCYFCMNLVPLYGQIQIIDETFLSFISSKFNQFREDTIFTEYEKDSVKIVNTKKYKNGVIDYYGGMEIYRYSNNNSYQFYKVNEDSKLVSYNEILNNQNVNWGFKSNGNLQLYQHYDKGKLYGISYVKTDMGSIIELKVYKNDTLDGHQISFYDNGFIKEEVTYFMGIPQGIYRKYSEKGNIKEEGLVSGTYFCIFDSKEFVDVWYYNNERIQTNELPSYIPRIPDQNFNYNTKYYAKVGKWQELNENNELIIIDWGYR